MTVMMTPFARRLVRTTDQAFTIATAQGELANLVRIWVAPVVIPAALRFEASREWAFGAVSQIGVKYRHSPLSEGMGGASMAGTGCHGSSRGGSTIASLWRK